MFGFFTSKSKGGYSILVDQLASTFSVMSSYGKEELSWMVTGFTMGEGCFSVIVRKHGLKKVYLGCEFKIGLKKADINILHLIKEILRCGHIYISKNAASFVVADLSDIVSKVIPFFDEYPLMNAKAIDYQLFKVICYKRLKGEAHNVKGLNRILAVRKLLNSGGYNRKYERNPKRV